jgi:DNA polymerase III psi subunit
LHALLVVAQTPRTTHTPLLQRLVVSLLLSHSLLLALLRDRLSKLNTMTAL